MEEKYVKSAAYHEAGHLVVAALCGFPLRKGGLRIDEKGFGLACFKKPDDPKSSRGDSIIIVVAYAGLIAQHEFYGIYYPSESCPTDGANTDLDEVYALLNKHSNARDRRSAEDSLRERSKTLVCGNWGVIEALAKAVWKKDWAHQAMREVRWSYSPQCREKSMEGEEVSELLSKFGIVIGVER